MNLPRFKYILMSELIFIPLVYLANIATIYIFQLFNAQFSLDFIKILNESIFLASFISILLSTSKKVVIRFTNDLHSLKYNFTLTSLYIILHYIAFYVVDILKKDLENQNFSIIYISILLLILIYSNIKFKKIINDKK